MNTLLAVDGSENSSEAVRALNYLAEAAQLTLLHAVDAPSPAYTIMLSDEAEEHFGQSQRREGEHLLERVQSLLPPHAGSSTKVLRIGPPADVIVSMAEERNVDLIVMGVRGLGPCESTMHGSRFVRKGRLMATGIDPAFVKRASLETSAKRELNAVSNKSSST